jgi:hypothetical protein
MRSAASVLPVLTVALTLISVRPASTGSTQAPESDGWRTFAGTWSAVGTRRTLPTEGNRPAAIVQLSGSLVFADRSTLGSGFRGEVIGFDDGRSLSTGRAVWTDANGDRVFSVLRGDGVESGRRIAGTITGGTGRYAGVEGDYELTWQYVVDTDGGLQGRTVDLRGRVRRPGQQR